MAKKFGLDNKEHRIRSWITDAIDLDISPKVSKFRELLFHENYPIREFLRTSEHDRGSKFLIVAPKGYGKTLLLKSKRIEIETYNPQTLLLPHDGLIDRPPGTPPIFSGDFIDRKSQDIQYWKTLWFNSICLSVIQATDRSYLRKINSELIKSIYNDNLQYTAAEIFSKLLHSTDAAYFKAMNACGSSGMIPFYRSIRRPVALFIDNIDDYFFPHLQAVDSDSEIYKNSNRQIWVLAQVGLAEAIRELRDINPHIKLYAALRREALDRSYEITPNAQQLFGISVELKYSSEELKSIFVKNISFEPKERLANPGSLDPITRFVGEENKFIVHPYTGRKEPFFDFAVRHTMGRPRDLMRIGEAISNIDPPRRVESLRSAVFSGATSSVKKHLEDMKSFIAVPYNDIFKIINKNVLSIEDLKSIAEIYNDLMAKNNYQTNGHPFCSLYRLGLLGHLDINYESRETQKFQHPESILIDRGIDILPKAKYYLIHPALDELISTSHGPDYKMNFERVNVVGDGLPWENHHSPIFVCTADIVKYTDVMYSAEYNKIYPKIFDEWVREAFDGIKYCAVGEGDSLLAVDGSPLRLISAARRLAKRMSDFLPMRRSIRFGASAGPIEFRFREGSSAAVPEGIALRSAARIEQKAKPGTFLADDDFVAGAVQFGMLINEWTSLQSKDMPGMKIKNGKFVIQKNRQDTAILTNLWEVKIPS